MEATDSRTVEGEATVVAHLGLFQASLVVYAARPLIFIETGLIEGGPNGYYSPRA